MGISKLNTQKLEDRLNAISSIQHTTHFDNLVNVMTEEQFNILADRVLRKPWEIEGEVSYADYLAMTFVWCLTKPRPLSEFKIYLEEIEQSKNNGEIS